MPPLARTSSIVDTTMMPYRRSRRSPMMAKPTLFVALAWLALAAARLPMDRETIDERGRTLKEVSHSIFQGADAFQRGLNAHYPTSSGSPVSSPPPTASLPPASPSMPPSGSGSSKSAPVSTAPVSYKPSASRAPVSGGKGMMMPSGKGGGKGMMLVTKAPALPPKTKAPLPPPKTKAPVVPKSKKSKPPVAPKTKSKSKEAKKKLPKSPSAKSKKSSKSKSKISVPPTPTKPPQSKPPAVTAAPSSSSSSQPASPSASTPTSAPVPGGPTSVTLTLYQIGYVVSLTYIPSTEEVAGVVNVTQQYLSDFFQGLYSNMVGFETTKVSDRLMLNAPYEIVYNSTIEFAPGTTVPTLDELNTELQSAFTGTTKTSYLSMLSGLGPNNIFSQTTDVVFTFFSTTQSAPSDPSYSGGEVLSPTALAAIGAGTLAILVTLSASVHFFRHRRDADANKSLSPPPPGESGTRAGMTESSDDQHDVFSTANDTRSSTSSSCASPRSCGAETPRQSSEAIAAPDVDHDTTYSNNDHRNPRVYRMSLGSILECSRGGGGGGIGEAEGTASSAFTSRGPTRQTLSFEGDDEDVWMNSTQQEVAASGTVISSSSSSRTERVSGRRSQ